MKDVRSTNPNQSDHRRARFKEGWRKAVAGEVYSEETLKELTWDNLGCRLGKQFGEAPDELVDELCEWCVRQQQGVK